MLPLGTCQLFNIIFFSSSLEHFYECLLYAVLNNAHFPLKTKKMFDWHGVLLFGPEVFCVCTPTFIFLYTILSVLFCWHGCP